MARVLRLCSIMNWLVWLGIAMVIAVFAAVTGLKPKGTRPVAHTRMMGMGRLVLVAVAIIFVYIAYRAHTG
jgi:hypothetical protein